MRVGEMDENHLLSAIAMVERDDDWRKVWLPRLYMEMAARRCMVPPRMPVSPAEVAHRTRTKLGVLQEAVKLRAAIESNIRGWVEQLVTRRVEQAIRSSTSTKTSRKSRSKHPTGRRSKTARETLSSGTPSSRKVLRRK